GPGGRGADPAVPAPAPRPAGGPRPLRQRRRAVRAGGAGPGRAGEAPAGRRRGGAAVAPVVPGRHPAVLAARRAVRGRREDRRGAEGLRRVCLGGSAVRQPAAADGAPAGRPRGGRGPAEGRGGGAEGEVPDQPADGVDLLRGGRRAGGRGGGPGDRPAGPGPRRGRMRLTRAAAVRGRAPRSCRVGRVFEAHGVTLSPCGRGWRAPASRVRGGRPESSGASPLTPAPLPQGERGEDGGPRRLVPPYEAPMPPVTVGWKEFADFPDWGLRRVKVKLDTGARSAAVGVR